MKFHEIEQKFAVIPELLQCFRANKGTPPFHTLHHVGTYNIRDTYYDTSKFYLSKQGLGARYRNTNWESVMRSGGDFNKSRFPEKTNIQKAQDMVAEICKANRELGLSQICEFETERDEWKVDDKFTVMIERTDFGHWVGGVKAELLATVVEEEMEINSAITQIDIEAFKKRYEWFFKREGQTKGEFAAYFEMFGFPSGMSEQDVKSEPNYGSGLVVGVQE